MDFKLIMEKVLSAFEQDGIDYALIGGFALGVWGIPRATVDIDFIILLEDMEKAHAILTPLGYELHYKSDNVSQYVSPLSIFGEIDFLHAFRDISKSMLKRAERRAVFNGALNVRVLLPEDLIGLKVQAIANDPSRKNIDLADVELLMSRYGSNLDWQLLETYFELFDFNELFQGLRRQYGEIER